MKNLLLVVACIPLIIIFGGAYFASMTSWIWLPMVLNHWAGFLIGVFIAIVAEAIKNVFLGD